MIAWGSTISNSSINGLARLLSRDEWRQHRDGEKVRAALQNAIDSDDETIRMLSSMVLPLVVGSADLFAQLRARLIAEQSPSVREVLLSTLANQVAAYPDECDGCLERMAETSRWQILVDGAEDRLQPIGQRSVGVEDQVLQMLLSLGLYHQARFSSEVLLRWSNGPLEAPSTVGRLIALSRPYMNPSPAPAVDYQSRAFEMLSRVAEIVRNVAVESQTAVEAGRTLTETEGEALTSSGWIAMCIAREIYHSSGAFRHPDNATLPDNREVAPAFSALVFPLIELVLEVPAAAIAHHLVQTLVFLSRLEPKRAFLDIARIATPGSGYEFESLAENEVLDFLDSFLAEHRSLVLDDEECLSALRQILDTFVAVGSDRAIHRVQDLGEMFR